MKKLLTTIGFIALATILSKVFGLWRDILVAERFATSTLAQGFFAASRVPVLLFDFVVGGVVSSAFIPIFNKLLKNHGKPAAMEFAACYTNIVFLLCLIIAVFGRVFAVPLIDSIAPDLSTEAKELAVHLSHILFPMIIFTGLAFSFVGILQSFGEYNIPAIMSLVSNSLVIGYFYIFTPTVYGLSVVMLCGWALQSLVQTPHLIKFGFRPRLKLGLSNPYMKDAFKLALPMLISTWAVPLCSIINMSLASSFAGGRAVPAMEYANRLYIVVVGVFSFVITNLIFPKLSVKSVEGDMEGIRRFAVGSLKAIILIVTPICVCFTLMSTQIIRFLYERGSFTAEDTALTATALMFYSFGMIFAGCLEILNKTFFALHNSKTPMFTSTASMLINIGLCIILSRYFGVAGLAGASSLSCLVNLCLNYYFMSRKHTALFARNDAVYIVKTVASACVMALLVLLASSFLTPINYPVGQSAGNFIVVAISGGVGFIAYLVLVYLFGLLKFVTKD